MRIQVKPDGSHGGTLTFGETHSPCAIGKAGVTLQKREGDHASPIGVFALRKIYYRSDKGIVPDCVLPCHAITPEDGWCDDPKHPLYNQKISRPFDASHETLWRDDHLYDVIVVLGHNDAPPVPGAGSCIFMHVAKEGYTGTEGCVALKLPDLLALLKHVSVDTLIEILPFKTA